ncbi:hypothetical protein DEFDS_0247 [Deferribacter desulfuricans SSM1]|uniref:Class I SAM-dependent methyltransferase n=2 Tax=Deferribacter TaxID=53572 RepID=D3PAY2_DEFDS|nr:hypothetical protein DEFDS_0247 [Deferribacter desulfuricans SSM1]
MFIENYLNVNYNIVMEDFQKKLENIQKEIVNPLYYFINNNKLDLIELIKNVFVTLFVRKELVSCDIFKKLFNEIKNCPPQVATLFRQEYVRYSYFPLCVENILQLAHILKKYSNESIYEVAAGSGWLSFYLSRYGVGISKAIDNYSWDKLFEKELPIKVEREDAVEVIRNEKPSTVLINWPPPEDEFLVSCFEAMRKNSYLIVISDVDYKVTSNKLFFENYKNQKLYEEKLKYSFPGFNDTIKVYKKSIK